MITEFLPYARGAGPAAIGASILVGTSNALAEEAFWRALRVAVFPDDPVRGWLWPAAWFTASHLVPLTAAGAGRCRAGSVAPVLGAHANHRRVGSARSERLWLGHRES